MRTVVHFGEWSFFQIDGNRDIRRRQIALRVDKHPVEIIGSFAI